MLVSSSAPLPSNTLTPIPQSWVDNRNAHVNALAMKVAWAKAITDCYASAQGVAESVGPSTALEVWISQLASPQAASDFAGATMPSSSGLVSATGTNSTLAPVSSNPLLTAPPVWGPPPIVIPFNTVSLQAPSLPAPNNRSSCPGQGTLTYQQRMNQPQPKMVMPKYFPILQRGTLSSPRGLGDYSPAWGSARRGGQDCGGSGINWGGLVVAAAVAFGVMALIE